MARKKKPPNNRARNRAPKKEKDWRPAFLKELARTACVLHAAAKVKRTRSTVYDRRQTDAEFSIAWDDAIEYGNAALIVEARRRAYEGTLRPVYQGGKLRGKIREYSDTLLIFLIKARNPEFRDNGKIILQGDPAAPLKVAGELRKPDPAAFAAFMADVTAVIAGEAEPEPVAVPELTTT